MTNSKMETLYIAPRSQISKRTKPGKTRAAAKAGPGLNLNLNLRPFYLGGLLLVLFLSPFMRGLFFAPEFYTAVILVGITFLFCAWDQVLTGKVFLPRNILDWAVLGLVGAYALSLITAVHTGAAIKELMEALACFLIYICALRAARKGKGFDLIIITSYLAGLGVALVGVLAAMGVFPFPGAYAHGRIMSTFQYPNALAIYLVMLSICGLGLSVKTQNVFLKVFYALGNFLMLAVLLGSQSRGGWLVYPAALIGFFALLPEENRWRSAYHLIIPLGCALVASRGFYGLLRSGEGLQAGHYLVYGALAAAVLQVGYHFLASWLNRDAVNPAARRLAAICGISYLALVGAFYLYSSADVLPITGTRLLPAEMAHRAESISGYDPSFTQRLEYSRDALRIVKEYPITGAGGGGWNALYHSYQSTLYWSSETHNSFLQTWVETGTIGFLALLAIWLGLVKILWRFYKEREEMDGGPADSGLNIMIVSAAIGVLALGLHSFFDFDLSLPALNLTLFAFLGGIRGVTEETAAAACSWKKALAFALAGTIAGLALVLPARNFYGAGVIGAKGAQALQRQDLTAAIGHYEEAHRLDPYTASYAADLAQIYAAQAAAKDDAILHYKAIKMARSAAAAEPHNAQAHSVLLNVCLLLKEPGLAVEQAENLVQANPLLDSGYELLLASRLEAGRFYLNLAKEDQAGPFLTATGDIEEALLAKGLEPTPAFRLYQGQIALVAGRLPEAEKYLKEALETLPEGAGLTAKTWLAAAYARAGDNDNAQEIIYSLASEDEKFLQLYERLRKESSAWLTG